MKKLLLITILFLTFSCMKNDGEQLRSFVTFGEIVRNDITTLEIETDYSQRVTGNLSTPLISANVGDRLFVVGAIKSETENGYDADIYQIGTVDIKEVVEAAEDDDFGKDEVSVTEMIASGDYLNLFIPTDNHSVTLVVKKAKVENGILEMQTELFNEANGAKNDKNIISFDISNYLKYEQINLEMKYTGVNGTNEIKNVFIKNN